MDFPFRYGPFPDKILVDDDEIPKFHIDAEISEPAHLEAGDDGRDADLVPEFGIVFPDDALLEVIGVAGVFRDHVIDLLQVGHLGAAVVVARGDVDEDILGGLQVEVIQQRALEGPADGIAEAVFPASLSATHQGHAAVPHHLADIVEVDIDVTRFVDDLDDAPHGRRQHLIRFREGFLDEGVAKELIEFFVVDNQQAVHAFFQFVDSVDRLGLGLIAFVLEGNGHHGDGQDAAVLCHLGNDRRGARPGAAAHAGGDEQHLGPVVQRLAGDVILGFEGGVAAGRRVRPGAQSVRAHLDLDGDFTGQQGLRIGVADDEAASLDVLAVHVVDGIATAAADSDHFDVGVFARPVVGKNVVVVVHMLFLIHFIV